MNNDQKYEPNVADRHARQRQADNSNDSRRAQLPPMQDFPMWPDNGLGLDLKQALSLFKQGQLWGAMYVAGGVGLGVMLAIVAAYLRSALGIP